VLRNVTNSSGERDYIANPKTDGYRGVHLIYRYHSRARQYECYNGLQIEVQLRSKLQHAWATAVETASIFTGQVLKWRGGQEEWKRFFTLMGSEIAMRERKPLVPGTPELKAALRTELKALAEQLQVETVMRNWTTATQFLTGNPIDARFFLLRLDIKSNRLLITPYQLEQQQRASDEYLAAEKEIEDAKTNEQVVLVSAESVEALPRAYPNYYVDTAAFLEVVRQAIHRP
jgi:Region found in RelA / SpoT proteins